MLGIIEKVVTINDFLEIIKRFLNYKWILIFSLILNIYLYKKNKMQSTKVHEIHNKLSFKEKNLLCIMDRTLKTNSDISTFNDLIIPQIQTYLNEIANIIQLYTRQNIVVSIRIFSKKNSDLKQSSLIILSHSDYNDKNRDKYFYKNSKQCPKIIYENTEFLELIKKKSEYFYETDLKKYDENLRNHGNNYKNTTENWNSFYNSKVVVPIKVEKDKLHYIKSNFGDEIIGFLIVDTKSNQVFTKEKESFYISIIQGFASRLFTILNKYKFYLSKMKERDINDKKLYR